MRRGHPFQRVEVSHDAREDLRRLDGSVRERVLRAIRRYAETGQGNVRMVQVVHQPALRVGDWRVYFEEIEEVLRILRVEHRSRAYRKRTLQELD